MSLKEQMSRRSGYLGSITRNVRNIRGLMSRPTVANFHACERLVGQMLEVKARFDDAHDEVLNHPQISRRSASTCHDSATRASHEVISTLNDFERWSRDMESVGPNSSSVGSAHLDPGSSSNVQEATLGVLSKLHDAVSALGTDSVNNAVRAALTEQQLLHERETSTLQGKIENLSKELSRLSLLSQVAGSSDGLYSDTNNSGQDVDLRDGPGVGLRARNASVLHSTGNDSAFRDRPSLGRGRARGRARPSSILQPEPVVGHNVDDAVGMTWNFSSAAAAMKDLMSQTLQQSSSLLANIQAPKVKLQPFEGNPLEYVRFTTAFDELVHDAYDNDRSRLLILSENCSGRARVAIDGCMHLDAESGYAEARKILKNKFGSDHLITQAWLDKLMGYPQIVEGDMLEAFAVDVEACRNSLRALGSLREMECTSTLQRIIFKLPRHVRHRWRKLHRQSRDEGGSKADLLVQLIKEAADDDTDPAFSETVIARVKDTYDTAGTPKSARSGVGSRRTGVFAGYQSAEDDDIEAELHAINKSSCAACRSGQHFTSRCRNYRELTPAGKLDFVRAKKLCLLCLADTHAVVNCPLPWKCQDRSCGRRHHTSLHAAFDALKQGPPDTQCTSSDKLRGPNMVGPKPPDTGVHQIQQSDEAGLFTSYETDEGCAYAVMCAGNLSIAKVTVRYGKRSINTYALLDSGATLTLCRQDIMDALKLPSLGMKQMAISTISGKSFVNSDIVAMHVSECGNNIALPLNGGLVVKNISVSMNGLAKGSDIAKFRHLKGLRFNRGDEDCIGLLIGQNNAHLIDPKEVVRGGYYDPYAVGTPLGWVLYGNTKEDFARGDKLMPPHSGNPSPWQPGNMVSGVNAGSAQDSAEADEALEGYVNAIGVQDCLSVGDLEPDILAPDNCVGNDRSDTCATQSECDFVGCSCSDDDLYRVLQRLAELEHVPEADTLTKEERYVLELWEREMSVEDGHIVLPIPFKSDPPDLINNFVAAYRALVHLGNQLLKNKEKLKQYRDAVLAYFEKGYAEIIWDAHPSLTEFVWYMLHHGVDHPRKPGVTRVVKHGGAKYKGYCLNSAAYPGPNLINNLTEVLTRFRQFEVGTTGDIEGMFNQVYVPVKQRDYSRFLFWEDGDPTKHIIICRMKTHIFGTVWAPAAANFALKKTAELFAADSPETREAIQNEFYVDDWAGSQVSDQEAVSRYTGIRETVGKGGFNLVKLTSNRRGVIKNMPTSLRVKELARINLESERLPLCVLLGQPWFPEDDNFGFRVMMEPRPYTRRGMTSCIASIFDPLGLIAPFILPAKLLLQSSGKSGTGWDQELLTSTSDQWAAWLQQLPEIESFRLRRWFGCDKTSIQHIHMFSDACEKAYGAASYLAVKRGSVNVSMLVTSKSKVATPNRLTIPKMEMAGAVLSVKLLQLVKRMFGVFITGYYLWVDSTIVLVLIRKDPDTLRTFMGNRVAYIHSVTDVKQWGHVAGKLNPADLSSRGESIAALADSDLWLEGPDFLKEDADSWEKRKLQVLETPDVSGEERKEKPVVCGMVYSAMGNDITATMDECQSIKSEMLPDRVFRNDSMERSTLALILSRYSSWVKAVRLAVILSKYVEWLVIKHRTGDKRVLDSTITAGELNLLEFKLIAWDQSFSLEPTLLKESSWKQLTPFWDEVWRVGGRCQFSELETDVVHPIILPRVSRVTELLIREAHLGCGHGGADRTVMELRGRFWVLGGKPTVRKFLDPCVTCKRLKGLPERQMMGPLPPERVSPGQPAFTHSGVDLFGPIEVIVKRSRVKRYGAIFTCFNSRAVHLEPVEDLSASAFLDVIERFCMRRKRPESLRSDNGTNFVRADKEMDRVLEMLAGKDVAIALANKRIEWKFNTPSASHQGGVWERLIRTVRQILTVELTKQPVTDSRFHTVLCIAEGILNSRPLTRLTNDVTDLEPLTPGHFTCGSRISSAVGGRTPAEQLRQDWRLSQDLAEAYWNQWLSQYLPLLQKRTKWLEVRDNVRVGELVLVVNDQCPRFEWPLGRIRETYTGRDGLVRNVLLRTGRGLIKRPIQKIVRLELDVP